MKLFRRKKKIKGYIAYYGLEEWWLNDFSKEERDYIVSRDEQYRFESDSQVTLTTGNIEHTNCNIVNLLCGLADLFKNKEDIHLAKRIMGKAEELAENKDIGLSIIDRHFMYSSLIEIYYKDRASSASLEKAINACHKQINIAEEAFKAFVKDGNKLYKGRLPLTHIGFTQLAIILEKDKKFDEVIKLSQKAIDIKWAGDWEIRIARSLYKQSKYKEAMEYCRKMFEERPELEDTWRKTIVKCEKKLST